MSDPLPVYVLDANVLMEAHRRYYAFGICPGFWNCVIHHHLAARIISVDRVRDEIDAGDELEAWVKKTAPKSLFASTADVTVTANFADMVQWVEAQSQFKPEAKAEFATVADGWIVAYARANPKHIVVTHEEYAADVRKKVPLPNVCKQFGVEHTDTFVMLKDLKARFDWAKP